MGANAITIKGTRSGLIVTVDAHLDWAQAEAKLIETIEGQERFFKGARVALQLGDRPVDRETIRKLREKLASRDVDLWALLGTSPEAIRAARREGLDTDLPEAEQAEEAATSAPVSDGELPPIDNNEYGASGVLVKTTLRSGRIIRHVGHVVVIGDVNPGSQIIAGGDIVVFGRLRGTVHAGANGDEDAMVCALDMRPTQLRIANHVAISPEDKKPRPRPEIASVREGQIVAEEWGT
ncbi:MAG: septum site-determining protein MinC [Chloroflexi bacterium]|nr:septum site-determining protein MinC [Chloroflexota bacterium]